MPANGINGSSSSSHYQTQHDQQAEELGEEGGSAPFATKKTKGHTPSHSMRSHADQGDDTESMLSGSSPQPLQSRAITPHLDEEAKKPLRHQFKDILGRNPLDQFDLLLAAELVGEQPWLIMENLDCLQRTDSENQATFMHYLVSEGSVTVDTLLQLLTTPQGIDALKTFNSAGAAPIHIMAVHRADFPTFVKKIPDLELLVIKDRAGGTPLHYAIQSPYVENGKALLKTVPESLLAPLDSNITPFRFIMFNPQLSVQEKLELFNQAALVEGFVETLTDIHHLPSGIPEVDQRVQELVKANLTPSIPVVLNQQAINAEKQRQASAPPREALDLAEPQQVQTEKQSSVVDKLDLASSVKAGADQFEQKARQLVAGLEKVGVYGRFGCYPQEMGGDMVSFGDENASVQLLKGLVALDTPTIQLRLGPPDAIEGSDSTRVSLKSKAERTKEENHQLQKMQDVAKRKLAILMPESGFDPNEELPQTIKMGNSQIHIIGFEDSVENEPQLEVGFIAASSREFSAAPSTPNHYMVLHPYRYRVQQQCLHLDITGNQNNFRPLNLPPNAVLQTDQVSDVEVFDHSGSEKQWLKERLASAEGGSSKHAEQLADISSLTREGNIDTGLVYGLHHSALTATGGGASVLSRWLEAQKNRDRPTLLFIHKSRTPKDIYGEDFLKKAGIPTVDLGTKEAEQWLTSFKEHAGEKNTTSEGGKVIVCRIPDLPKPVFNHLMDTTNLPALVEGANTTAHLVANGHTFLSVLPLGTTSIAYEMGYPLEALKQEASSFKLLLNQKGVEVMEKVHQLAAEEKYTEAIKHLESNAHVAPYPYLFDSEDSRDKSGLKKVSVSTLLKKGQAGQLGEIEKEALLVSLDPSSESLSSYTEDCLNEESATSDHFKIQRDHMSQPFNKSLEMGLVKFAQAKKLDL